MRADESGGKIDDKNEKYETRMHKYIGETNLSSHERGTEHLENMRTIKGSSHLLKHILDKHEGETLDEVDFRMRVVRFLKAAFKRQIFESVLIQAPFTFEFQNGIQPLSYP